MRTQSILYSAVVLGVFTGACSSTTTEKAERSAEAITSGTADDADTAAVLVVAKVGKSIGYCSGVVVSPHVVLTAAHCTTLKADYSIFLGGDHNDVAAAKLADNYIDIVERHPHPKYDASQNTSDVGVLITKTPIPRAPVALNRQPMTASSVGQPIRIVGFGQTSSDPNSLGRRTVGTASIADYDGQTLTVKGTPNICVFDSGGPTFLSQNGSDVLAGIHYLVDSAECNSQGYDMRVDAFTDFVDGYIASAEAAVDAGAPSDDAATSDGPAPSASSTGCAMAASGQGSSFAAWLALAGAIALGRRRARSRQSSIGCSWEMVPAGSRRPQAGPPAAHALPGRDLK